MAAVVVAASVTLAGSQIKTRGQAAADAQPPEASAVTAVVEQRILVQTVSFRGRVRSRQEVPVIAAASAATSAVVVTDTPNRSGAVVTEGSVVIEVSGRPVVVLGGSVPMYRDLRPGSSGPDVAAVQTALERLGFPAGDPVGAFGGGTRQAVAAFWESLGYEATLTSVDASKALAEAQRRVSDGELALRAAQEALEEARGGARQSEALAAEAAVRAAEREYQVTRVRAEEAEREALAEVQLAAAPPRSSPTSTGEAVDPTLARTRAEAKLATVRATQAAAVANAADRVAIARAALQEANAAPKLGAQQRLVEGAQASLRAAREAYAALDSTSGAMVPRGEVVFVERFPASVLSLATDVGKTPEGPMLVLASGDPVVEAVVNPADRRLLKVGDEASVEVESSPGRGRAALSVVSDEFVAPKDGPGGHPVTAVPEQPLDPSLLGRETRIVVEGAKTSDKALVVPLSGVFSRADGSSRVTRVGADGDQESLVVRPGLSAGGFVAVESENEALRPGDRILIEGARRPGG